MKIAIILNNGKKDFKKKKKTIHFFRLIFQHEKIYYSLSLKNKDTI